MLAELWHKQTNKTLAWLDFLNAFDLDSGSPAPPEGHIEVQEAKRSHCEERGGHTPAAKAMLVEPELFGFSTCATENVVGHASSDCRHVRPELARLQ